MGESDVAARTGRYGRAVAVSRHGVQALYVRVSESERTHVYSWKGQAGALHLLLSVFASRFESTFSSALDGCLPKVDNERQSQSHPLLPSIL